MKKIIILLILILSSIYSRAQVYIDAPDEICLGDTITLTAVGADEADSTLQIFGQQSLGPFPIGFNFTYYGNTYDSIYIGSNGWVSFSPDQPKMYCKTSYGTWHWYGIPETNPNIPKNCIMGPWENWNFNNTGILNYATIGQEPNKKLVVSWCSVPMDFEPEKLATFQIVIDESTNTIENHVKSKPRASPTNFWSRYGVQGLQNIDGTKAVPIPGHNLADWKEDTTSYQYTWINNDYTYQIIDFQPEGIATEDIVWYKKINNEPYQPFDTGKIVTDIPTSLDQITYKVVTRLCCTGAIIVEHTVNVKPIPTADFDFTKPCFGDTTIFTDESSPSSASGIITNWFWDFGDGNTSTEQNPHYLFSSQGIQDVSLTVTENNSCTNTKTKDVLVTPFPAEPGPISGLTTVCQDQTTPYKVPDIQDSDSIIWSLPPGASIVSGLGTDSIMVYYNFNASSGNLTVKGVNDCGIGPESLLDITVQPLPDTAGEITGVSPVVKGQTGVPYSVDTIANANSYEWTVPTGASIASGAGTKSITVDFSMSAVSGYVTVKGVNDCGKGVMSSFIVVVGNLPGPAGDISGDDSVCINNDFDYEVDEIIQAETYIWSVPNGANIISGDSTRQITVHFSPSAVSGKITVKGHNTYGDGPVSELNIFVSDIPDSAEPIQGTDIVCKGDININYYIPEINRAEYYQWHFPNGISIISGNNTNNVTVNISLNAVSGNIKVKGVNYCGNGGEAILYLTVNPLPTAIINGSTEICKGDTAILIVDLTGTKPWTIVYTDGETPITKTNIISSPDTLKVNPDITTTYSITTVSDSNTCTNTGTGSATVVVHPLPTATINGDNSICRGQKTNISIDLTGNPPWDLIYSEGITLDTITGINNTPYTFSVKPDTTTSYFVQTISDANLCSNSGTGLVTITVNPVPKAKISCDTAICDGDMITFTDSSSVTSGNITSWNWDFDDNGNTSDLQNPNYTFNNIGNHNVKLEVSTENGCTDKTSINLMVYKNPVVNPVCNDECIIYGATTTLDAGGNFVNYKWNDGTEDRYLVIDKYGDYSVEVTDTNGCSSIGTIKVKQCPGRLRLPNAFTPNGDGKNDKFEVFGSSGGVTKFKMYIYDRWGKLLFNSNDIKKVWDGTYNGRPCPSGVYAWIIFYREEGTGEGEKFVKGYVTLVK